jgi:hypothetical protein
MKCKVYNENVKWTINEEFIEEIRYSLCNDKIEIAGSILFKDTNCSREGICDKESMKIHKVKGKSQSVRTPNGIINFHTHPKQCYIDEDTKYGWPSGEDIGKVMEFATSGNLVHIVFTLEGAYIIKVLKTLSDPEINKLEDLMKITHEFRLNDKYMNEQLLNFRKTFPDIKDTDDPVKTWLKLVNGMNRKKLHFYYNKLLSKGNSRSPPTDTSRILEVKLVPLKNALKFCANFVKQSCHESSFKFNKF